MPGNPALWEEEIGRIAVQAQTRKKVNETLSQKKKGWVWWHMFVIPMMQEAEIGGSWPKVRPPKT
jgi:hypothetical protein